MFDKISQLCVSRGFLQKFVYQKLKIEQFNVGPIGILLLNNLKTEWFNNIVINKDITVLPNNDNDTSETFNYAKQLNSERLPIGIADIKRMRKLSNEQILAYYTNLMKTKTLDFESCFRYEDDRVLTCTIYTYPRESTSFFHQWQKQRRIWWRKFSANPGRYSLTDIKSVDNKQYVEIIAKYPWGNQKIETLTLDTAEKKLTAAQLQFRDGRKICPAHSITSEVMLSTLFINTLCDAFEESTFLDKQRLILRLHRKLAPYKIGFSISGGTSSVSELRNLAIYLCKLLRTSNVSCLLLPNSWKNTLEAQYKHHDELGIPFTVVLNESTLRDGILHLRSRDTTLKEQVHVTNLGTYVEQLFKNY